MAKISFSLLAASLGLGQLASAGFDPSSQSNVAIYWGQNSYGQANSQSRLSDYCSSTELNIIPIAFMLGINNPAVNFASAVHACTAYSGTNLFNCPQIAQDIITCQKTYSKTILLSLGGATYTEGGFSSAAAAQAAADNVWNLFGPNKATANRPFGSAVVDGFDFDFESTTMYAAPFAQELRGLMDAATSAGDKKYYLSAAPQCPYPDAAMGDMLNNVEMDFVMVQFYNNYCGIQSFTAGAATQNNFNMDVWDTWAKTKSKNPSVKVLLGVPANTGAGAGYLPASQLAPIISYCKTFSSFGGVMMWDMSQAAANTGFLDGVNAALSGSAPPVTTSTSSSTSTTSSTTSSSTSFVTSSRRATASSSSTLSARSSSSSLTSSLFGRQSTATVPTCACPTAQTVTVTATVFTGSAGATRGNTSSTSSTKKTSMSTSSTKSAATTASTGTAGNTQLVAQWQQCGGQDYKGPTQCKSPYTCVRSSEWWSACQ